MRLSEIKEQIKEVQEVFPDIKTKDAFFLVLKMEDQKLYKKANVISEKDLYPTVLESIAIALGFEKVNPKDPTRKRLV